jgi:hypothetical protein
MVFGPDPVAQAKKKNGLKHKCQHRAIGGCSRTCMRDLPARNFNAVTASTDDLAILGKCGAVASLTLVSALGTMNRKGA